MGGSFGFRATVFSILSFSLLAPNVVYADWCNDDRVEAPPVRSNHATVKSLTAFEIFDDQPYGDIDLDSIEDWSLGSSVMTPRFDLTRRFAQPVKRKRIVIYSIPAAPKPNMQSTTPNPFRLASHKNVESKFPKKTLGNSLLLNENDLLAEHLGRNLVDPETTEPIAETDSPNAILPQSFKGFALFILAILAPAAVIREKFAR